MKAIHFAVSFFVLLVSFTNKSWASPIFGRYVGVLRHEKIQKDQLAKLDFILSREEGNTVQLMAVLTLHFGDFKSEEYIAYHFDNVQYVVSTNTFVFNQPDQGVTLISKTFDGDQFVGEFRVNSAGTIGNLILKKDGEAKPQLPLIEPLWGEYRGTCNQIPTVLQLETYRSPDDATGTGNAYASYRIKGQLGENHGDDCILDNTSQLCLYGLIESGTYNFFKERLTLFGSKTNYVCNVNSGGLVCNGCELKRVSDETKPPRAFSPPTSTSSFSHASGKEPAMKGPIDSIQGEYTGFVHHAYLNRYQTASLNIVAYEAPDSTRENPKIRMSGLATLYFGGTDSAESISYSYDERTFPNIDVAPQFVLKRPEADVDGVIQINSIGDGVVKGTWYSLLFGRVGDFEFRKDAGVKVPQGANLFEPVSANYESTEWDLELLVGEGKKPPKMENAFFPLLIGGHLTLRGIGARELLSGGTYDFYTGRIGIEKDSFLFLGERPSRKSLRLVQSSYGVLSTLRSHEPRAFRFIP